MYICIYIYTVIYIYIYIVYPPGKQQLKCTNVEQHPDLTIPHGATIEHLKGHC